MLRADQKVFSYCPSSGIGRVATDPAIERVAFDRFAPGFNDESLDLLAGEQLGRGALACEGRPKIAWIAAAG